MISFLPPFVRRLRSSLCTAPVALSLLPPHIGYSAADFSNPRFELDPFMVTASAAPRYASDYTTLADSIDWKTVSLQPAGNFGQLLDTRPGVHTSGFAPGAGRPIIRGFSGPRVQILEDGMGVFDASATSDDHAVGSEPFLASAIEILRGPANLFYGGNAIGGVVNVVTETAPVAPLSSPTEGRLYMRYEDGNDGWTGGGVVAVGTEKWAIRLGTLVQQHEDYRVPDRYLAPHPEHDEPAAEHKHEEAPTSVLENSFTDRASVQAGGSWFLGGGGRLSIFARQLDALYGVPGHAHPESPGHAEHSGHAGEVAPVRVDMRSRRAGFVMDTPLDGKFFEHTRLDFAYTRYEHRELEGEHLGTTFARDSVELRSEWGHRTVLGNTGIGGVHAVVDDFRAYGEEAFTPPTKTVQAAVFWMGEREGETFSLRHGLRVEWQESRAKALPGRYEGLALSASSGAHWQVDARSSLGMQVSVSQRHPSGNELFSEGAHLAAGRFEVGDPGLGVETAIGLDLTYRIRRSILELMVAGYLYRFDRYIHETPSGAIRESLPVFQYRQEDALIGGMEAGLTAHLVDREHTRLHLVLSGDWVRLEALQTKGILPRNPPARLRAGLFFEHGTISADLGVSRVFARNSGAEFESPTDAFTLINLRLASEFGADDRAKTFFIEVSNLRDELGFHHLAYRKESKPLPGRSVSSGILVRF